MLATIGFTLMMLSPFFWRRDNYERNEDEFNKEIDKYCAKGFSDCGYGLIQTGNKVGIIVPYFNTLKHKDNAIRKEVEKLRGTTFTDKELESIIIPILNSQGLRVVPIK